MVLSGKKVAQTDAKCSADFIYGLLRYSPNDLSIVAPDYVKGCELHEGVWGAVGSKINWNYLIEGKTQATKEVIEAADEKNKSITFRAVGGDIMQIYKSFKAIVNVHENGENSMVTWTIEYEKLNEDIPEPDAFVDLACKLTKAIGNRQLQPQ